MTAPRSDIGEERVADGHLTPFIVLTKDDITNLAARGDLPLNVLGGALAADLEFPNGDQFEIDILYRERLNG